MKNTIFFKPAPQIENTGDLLINKSELILLRNYGTVIIDDSNAPDWFLKDIVADKDILMSSISSSGLYKSVKSYIANKAQRDERVTLMIHPGHRSRKGFISALKTLYSSFRDRSLKSAGGYLVRAGFSIGPYDTLNGKMDAFASKNYDYFGLRDYKSIKLAKELNFREPEYFPDLAWAYKPDHTLNEDKDDTIVISLRSNQYGEDHSESYLQSIAEKLKNMLKLTEIRSKVLIIYQVKYDREASVYLNELLSNDFQTEFIDKKLSLAEAEAIYSKAKLVLSNRLHVLLLAFQCGALALPFIVPNDNKKIVGIYSDNKIGDLMLDSNADEVELAKQLNLILEDSDELMKRFEQAAESNTVLIKQELDKIFK